MGSCYQWPGSMWRVSYTGICVISAGPCFLAFIPTSEVGKPGRRLAIGQSLGALVLSS
jgi:hypothetical protein